MRSHLQISECLHILEIGSDFKLCVLMTSYYNTFSKHTCEECTYLFFGIENYFEFYEFELFYFELLYYEFFKNEKNYCFRAVVCKN